MEDVLRTFMRRQDEMPERPYFPYPSAIQAGAIDFDNINMRRLSDPIGVILANGRKPQPNDAGIVPTDPDSGEFVAIDHASLTSVSQQKIELAPTNKDAVNKQSGEFQDEGLLTITRPDGLLRVVGVVVDHIKHPWLAEQLGAMRATGRMAVVQFGLEILDYEVSDVDAKTGIITAKPRTKPR